MSETNHAPTPQISVETYEDGQQMVVIDGVLFSWEVIARRCNSHAALVAALEQMQRTLWEDFLSVRKRPTILQLQDMWIAVSNAIDAAALKAAQPSQVTHE